MKKSLVIATAVVAVGLSGTPETQAGHNDKAVAAVAGFIGGAIVGSALHGNSHHSTHVTYRTSSSTYQYPG